MSVFSRLVMRASAVSMAVSTLTPVSMAFLRITKPSLALLRSLRRRVDDKVDLVSQYQVQKVG